MKKNNVSYAALRAFTLVELLVVISIIALLLSILMPALNKVRTQGKIVACGSNLKQLGIGIAGYMTDSRDRYPPYWAYPQGANPNASGSDGSPLYYDRTDWPRLIQPYVGGGKIAYMTPFTKAYFCPLGPIPGRTQRYDLKNRPDIKKAKDKLWPTNASHYVTYGYNANALGMNDYFAPATRSWNGTPASGQVRASEFLVLVDNVTLTDCSMSFVAIPSASWLASRNHPGSAANVLWGDTHVAATSRKQIDDPFFDDPPDNYRANYTKWKNNYPWKMVWDK